ncbi:MAG: hypothetical protein IPN33_25730 [Saprospiraceae bacterium]|nr:hypothetical protein [Saprospiraceae bacterium]
MPESKTACAYREFIKNQPDTEIGRQADKILQEQILPNGISTKTTNYRALQIEFQFSNVVQPRVDTIYGSAKKNLDTSKFACSGRLIIYDVTNPDSLYISISDKGKPNGKDSLVIILGNIFTVKTIRFDTDSIILLFNKGNPPYRITFYDAVGRPMMQPIGGITDTLWSFKVSQLTENKVYGAIHLEVNDSGNGLFISGDLNFEPPSQPWYWLLLLVLLLRYITYACGGSAEFVKILAYERRKSAADLDLPP